MKIERFKYHEKFSIKSTFLDTSIDVEGVLEEGETLKDAVIKARAEIMTCLPPQELKTTWQDEIPGPLPTISLEETPDQSEVPHFIQASKTIEELSSYKILAGTNLEWTKLYVSRLKELTK
jgi:hypothetical protein